VVGIEDSSYLVALFGFSFGSLRASDMGNRMRTFRKNDRDATKAKTFRKIVVHIELTVIFDVDANYKLDLFELSLLW